MKGLVLLLVVALALPVGAQEKKPAAKEPAKKTSSKRHEDARHCLEKGSSAEIIRCAEAYL